MAGCSQETLEFAQSPVSAGSDPQSETKANPVTLPPQPKEPVPAITDPKVVTSPTQPSKERAKPVEINPTLNPAEVDPAEVVARKLISDDPKDNLEVLNKALQMWLTSKGELPEKIGDLVAEQLLPMLPMAPQGKIFEIDREAKRVVLVAEK
ncbi:MAG: hypothetical protein QF685_13295 [Verrucomicrobiota bacterium]|nr:hypothetical protein [Verrucomicrobiota bacterium]